MSWPDLVLMRAKNADAIVHLAAAINVDWSQVAPDLAYDINVGGTLNILEAARKLDKKVVYASSSEVYGTLQPHHCRDEYCGYCDHEGEFRTMSERHQLDGQSPYASSKIAADRMCKAWKDTYGMDINIVRLFNTFGPFQADDGYGGVIAKFTRQCLAGQPMTIFGRGEQRRDYLWIDDAVSAYVLALNRTFDTPVNFGTGTTVSVREIATSIAVEVHGSRIADQKSLWEFGPERPGEVECLRCDNSKALALGWQPTVTFQDGLRRYVTWSKQRS